MQGLRSAIHMQAPAHSLKFTRAAIKQALGASVEELFEEFEEQPVASGSIGQVYQAKLSAKGARNTGIDPGGPRPLTPCMLQPCQLTRPPAGSARAFSGRHCACCKSPCPYCRAIIRVSAANSCQASAAESSPFTHI